MGSWEGGRPDGNDLRPTFWEELASLRAGLDSLIGTLDDLGRIAEGEGIDAAGPFVVGEAEHSAVVGFTRDRLAVVSEVVRTITGTVNHIADVETLFRRENRPA